jgi:hypothetical protein
VPDIRNAARNRLRAALIRANRPGVSLRVLGHRDYVGALWEQVGILQFEFMVSQGLRPQHVLLDVGCGSLRGGVHFIPYLEPGNYLGIDKERRLIRSGLKREISKSCGNPRDPSWSYPTPSSSFVSRGVPTTRSLNRFSRTCRPR